MKNEGLGLSSVSCFLNRSQTFNCLVWVHKRVLLGLFQENLLRRFLWYKHRIVFNCSEVFSLCLAVLGVALEGFAMAIGTDTSKKLSVTVTVGVAGEGSLPSPALCLWNGSGRPFVHSQSQGCLEFPAHVCLFAKLLQRDVWAYSEPDGHGRATACFYLFLCIQEVREHGHSALNSSNECCMIYTTTFPNWNGLFFSSRSFPVQDWDVQKVTSCVL